MTLPHINPKRSLVTVVASAVGLLVAVLLAVHLFRGASTGVTLGQDGVQATVSSFLKDSAGARLFKGSGTVSGRRIILRYVLCGGLMNQHYCHISAFMLASVLKAEVVFPLSIYRNSFGIQNFGFAQPSDLRWYTAPSHAIWDMKAIIDNWRDLGVVVHEMPLSVVNGTAPTYPNLTYPNVDPRLTVRMPYARSELLAETAARARAALGVCLDSAPPELQKATDYVVLDMPCTFFQTRTFETRPLAMEVARALPFSHAMVDLALRTVEKLRKQGAVPFNGVHLRIETDAGDWMNSVGGMDGMMTRYIHAMQAAEFNKSMPLYIATGLLTYGADAEWKAACDKITSQGLASKILSKHKAVNTNELKKLNTAQDGLLDFLILSHSERFVGFGPSTFSFFLTQYRMLLRGATVGRDILADMDGNELFTANAVIVDDPAKKLA